MSGKDAIAATSLTLRRRKRKEKRMESSAASKAKRERATLAPRSLAEKKGSLRLALRMATIDGRKKKDNGRGRQGRRTFKEIAVNI